VLNGWIPTGKRVANYHKVWLWIEVFWPKPLHQIDTHLFQLRTHWRIDIGIAAANAVSELFSNYG
jgi:hypothetical protein